MGMMAAGCATAQQAATLPPDSEVHKILVQRIDDWRQSIGIVVGLIDSNGQRIIAYGKPDQKDTRTVDADTVYEIGSVTKVFTSLLLADMVERGEVSLSDPVVKYLPAGVKVPERGGRVITLADLATHTSGLPRIPTNLPLKDLANPYAAYTPDMLYQFLSGYELTRDIGSQYEYSNLGGGLLGHALARRAGMDYETLVRTRITKPLKMESTAITLTPQIKERMAVGHNPQMAPVSNWDFDVLAGCGALRSNANDMLAFVAANLGYTKTPLAPAMAAMLRVRKPTGGNGLDIALGWHILKTGGREIVWHNGGTGGFRSFIGFDAKARIGVVVLSNAMTMAGVDDIGVHLLDSSSPLMKPPAVRTVTRTQVWVDPKVFEGYVGKYSLMKDVTLAITQSGNQLYVQATNQPMFELLAETPKDFFMTSADIQITFETDANGRATALVLHQRGIDKRAKRTE
jgi:CubicO group peptidase (beta-lactamase class C family)